ncbi:hypothetical protein BGZ80_001360 [Entomortierella chlamydospora]|uniref:Uncharacterized protein n=1 Tax=Entomortierella chlamydospora TaxID=101097 RepID=A0A9P6MS45_9FUNG|nr:hypothetical protein BGZ79_004162 [Entomortierella chlamydospora]KAG0010583.1 hypothetical protein BGZ80_001360 [Entomortierella chlamydospora]
MDQDKGYYAAQPPQYPQQAHPAYGQPVYGEAASYQPQPGYPQTPAQGYYAQPTPQANPVIIQQQPHPQNSADDCLLSAPAYVVVLM